MSSTGSSRFGHGDLGYRARCKQHLCIRHAFRDVNAVTADTLDHSHDDVLISAEVPVDRASGIAGSRLNRGLKEGSGRAHRNHLDESAVRPPQILQFESVAAQLSVMR